MTNRYDIRAERKHGRIRDLLIIAGCLLALALANGLYRPCQVKGETQCRPQVTDDGSPRANRRRIDDLTARVIAASWHSGQSSPLYALAS